METHETKSAATQTSSNSQREGTSKSRTEDVPRTAPTRWVEVLGRRVAVYEGGERGPGVLLLHGVPVNSHINLPLIEELRGHARVKAVDLPGYGESALQATGFIRLNRFGEWIDNVIDSLFKEPPIVVVHDLAGIFGLPWLLQNRTRVAGVVILNTTLWRDDDNLPLTVRLFLAPVLGSLLRPFTKATFQRPLFKPNLRNLFHREPRLPDARLQLFWEQFERGDGKDAFRDFLETREESMRDLEALPLEALLRDFDRPVLLVWGMRDPIFSETSIERFARLLPKLEEKRIPDAGHFLQYEAAAEVGAAIREFVLARKS